MRIPRTLYILADGGRVRYIERTGPGHFHTFRKFISAHMHEKSSALSSDRPGRIRESATPVRHAVTPKTNPRDKIEARFVQSVADDLGTDTTLGNFDNLVLVAPARLLKTLRESLSPALTTKLVECIDKDFTKIADGELHRHLPVFLQSPVAVGSRPQGF